MTSEEIVEILESEGLEVAGVCAYIPGCGESTHYNSHYVMDRLKDIAKHEGMDFILVVNKFADLRQKDATAVNLHNRIDALYEELKIEEVNDAWDEYCKSNYMGSF